MSEWKRVSERVKKRKSVSEGNGLKQGLYIVPIGGIGPWVD